MKKLEYLFSDDCANNELVGKVIEWEVEYYGKTIKRGLSLVQSYVPGERRPFNGMDFLEEQVRWITSSEIEPMHYSDADRYVKARVVEMTEAEVQELIRLKKEDDPYPTLDRPYPSRTDYPGGAYSRVLKEWIRDQEDLERNRPLMKFIRQICGRDE